MQDKTEKRVTTVTRFGETRRFITKKDVVFDKIPMTPITLFRSKKVKKLGRIITTNDKLLVYVVRDGDIRIINKFSGFSKLIKSSLSNVTDVFFLPETKDMLVKTGSNGELVMLNVTSSEKNDQITSTIYSALKLENGEYVLKFFSFKGLKLICYTSNYNLYCIDLENFKKEEEGLKPFEVDEKNVFLLKTFESDVTSMDISQDKKSFVVGYNNGNVRVYEIGDNLKMKEKAGFCGYPMCEKHKDLFQEITTAKFLDINNILLGSGKNSILSIWNITTNNAKQLHTLEWINEEVLLDEIKEPIPFGNVLLILEDSSYIVLGSMDTTKLAFIKLEEKSGKYYFDNMKIFDDQYPIISGCTLVKQVGQHKMVGIFSVQTDKIQLMHISSSILAEQLEQPEIIQEKEVVETVEMNEKVNEKENEAEEEEEVPEIEEKSEVKNEDEGETNTQDVSEILEEKKDPIKEIIKDEEKKEEKDTTKEMDEIERKITEAKEDAKRQMKEMENKIKEDIVEVQEPEKKKVQKKKNARKEKKVKESISESQIQKLQKNVEQRLFVRIDERIRHLYNSFEKDRQHRLKVEQQNQKELLNIISKTIMEEIPDNLSNLINERIQKILPAVHDITTTQVSKNLSETIKTFEKEVKKISNDNFNGIKRMNNTQIQKIEKTIKKSDGNPKLIKEQFKVMKNEILESVDKMLQKFLEFTTESIRKVVREEIKKVGVVGKDVINYDVLSEMIKEGKFLEVLEKILSSRDVDGLVWFMKNADLSILNRYKGGIEAPLELYLSLAQQASCQLEIETDLKFEWLKHTLLNIPPELRKKEVCVSVLSIIRQNVQDHHKKFPSVQSQLVLHVLNSLSMGN